MDCPWSMRRLLSRAREIPEEGPNDKSIVLSIRQAVRQSQEELYSDDENQYRSVRHANIQTSEI